MATVQNKKSEPLSLQDALNRFPRGIRVYQCQHGIVLVSPNGESEKGQWWVDLTSLIGDRTLIPVSVHRKHNPKTPDPYVQFIVALNEINNLVNVGQLGLKWTVVAFG